MKKLHSELRQKAADVRGRGSQLFKDWFFHNPISHLRECDGDRCEFWRFRYPKRREVAMTIAMAVAMEVAMDIAMAAHGGPRGGRSRRRDEARVGR